MLIPAEYRLYRAESGVWIAVGSGPPVVAGDLICGFRPGWHAVCERNTLDPADYRWETIESLYADGRRRLPLADAQEIFRAYWTGEQDQAELSRVFGHPWRTIHKIVHRYTYWML